MVKLAARLVRSVFYGILVGTILFLTGFFLGTAINGVAGTATIPVTPLSLGLFGIGFSAPIAMELSKDIEEDSKKEK